MIKCLIFIGLILLTSCSSRCADAPRRGNTDKAEIYLFMNRIELIFPAKNTELLNLDFGNLSANEIRDGIDGMLIDPLYEWLLNNLPNDSQIQSISIEIREELNMLSVARVVYAVRQVHQGAIVMRCADGDRWIELVREPPDCTQGRATGMALYRKDENYYLMCYDTAAEQQRIGCSPKDTKGEKGSMYQRDDALSIVGNHRGELCYLRLDYESSAMTSCFCKDMLDIQAATQITKVVF